MSKTNPKAYLDHALAEELGHAVANARALAYAPLELDLAIAHVLVRHGQADTASDADLDRVKALVEQLNHDLASDVSGQGTLARVHAYDRASRLDFGGAVARALQRAM